MFIEAIHRRAAHNPEGLAVVTEDRRVTNAELWAELVSLAAWLAREGLAPGDIVGITIKDEYRNLVASLAAMVAGLPQIALPTHDPAEVRQTVARRLKVSAVLVDRPEDGLAGFRTVPLDFSFRVDGRKKRVRSRLPVGDDCLYLTSSGTTGRAKIIPLDERQLFRQAMTAQLAPSRDVLYRPASIEFNNSRRHRFYCLASGGINVLIDPQRSDVRETCRKFGVTQLLISAAQARRLLDRSGEDAWLPEHTEMQVRGSPVSWQLRREIMRRINPRLAVGYGASEFGSIATAGPADHDRHPATLGTVHRGVELEIVSDDDRVAARNTSGRIRVRSAGMATRYRDDDQATAAAFRDGWFYPGDMGHIGENGDLRFDGRADEMMVLASINIFPAEIERAAEALPGVVECAAFSMKSAEFGDIPLLAVVGDGTAGADEILFGAKKALGLRAPRKVFLVDALPHNGEGKVQRTELRALIGELPTPRAVA